MNDDPTGGNRGRLLLGLIGAGIQSSLTPAMHEREAAEHGVVCLCQLIDLERLGLSADTLPDLLTAAERMGFSGLNITHPCKQSVLPLLTDFSSDARALGAVNTVVLRECRRWGHNTDWLAFSASFRRGLPGAPIGRIVQLGAGGAGAATAYAMLKMGAGHITILDLDPARADALAGHAARGSARDSPGHEPARRCEPGAFASSGRLRVAGPFWNGWAVVEVCTRRTAGLH